MKTFSIYIFAIISLIGFVACSDHEDEKERPMDTLAPVSLTLSVPTDKNGTTRLGDPGEDSNDKIDWDYLTIIAAYKTKTTGETIVDGEPLKMVYFDTFTKEDFESKTEVKHTNSTLSPADKNGFHDYQIHLPIGICCMYGVTYSEGQGFDLKALLSSIAKDGSDANPAVLNLQISNDYATSGGTMDVAKFISVATGYAEEIDPKTNLAKGNREIVVEQFASTGFYDRKYWRMILGRLATKVDIQWDAKGAYENGADGKPKFTDVKVQGFTYHSEAESTTSGTGTTAGTASATGATSAAGCGRLFPTLYATSPETVKTSVGGQKTFINTSEISKRNGRVYHYTFPDGSNTQPRIIFNVLTTKNGETEKTDKVTFKLPGGFNPARWYKINVTISGTQIGSGSNITIDNFNI